MKFTHADRKYPIQITTRDIEIFRLIYSEGAKASADLADRFWNTKSKKAKAAVHRIRKLVEAGLLERGNPKLLYLSDQAIEFLSKQFGMEGVKANARSCQ